MHPFPVEQFAEEHHRDLVSLAQAEHWVRRAGRVGGRSRGVGPLRQALGHWLVGLGVGVGLPRPQRDGAVRQARALIADDCC